MLWLKWCRVPQISLRREHFSRAVIFLRRKAGFDFFLFLLLLGGASLCCFAVGHAQEGGDVQAQILYAFESEDAARLRSVRDALRNEVAGGDASARDRYHLAHADYRLGELLEAGHTSQARSALGECIQQLDLLIEHAPQSVEALALQAACELELSPLKSLTGSLTRNQAERSISKAVALDPRNPRVQWVQASLAMSNLDRKAPIPDALRRAAEAFDHADATDPANPGWGHADAYLAYGRALRIHGDYLGARNWIEKALLIAPHSKRAQAELTALGH